MLISHPVCVQPRNQTCFGSVFLCFGVFAVWILQMYSKFLHTQEGILTAPFVNLKRSSIVVHIK